MDGPEFVNENHSKNRSIVQDSCVFRHNGRVIEVPPYTSQYDSAMKFKGPTIGCL